MKKVRGYRLHLKRILFSGGEIVRTIKFPIVARNLSKNDNDYLEIFKKNLIEDDIKIRGDLNLNDYLLYTSSNKHIYTLLNFWIDSLKSGIIWADKAASLIDFINDLYQFEDSPVDIIWNNASEDIKKFFDKDKFKEIIISDPLRATTKKESFKKRLISYLNNIYLEKNHEIKSKEAELLIEKIINNFFDEKGNLILDGKGQNDFWLRNFNLDKSIIDNAKPKGELADITFIIIPELIEDLNCYYTVEYLVKKRIDFLSEKINTSKKLEFILGLSNNFNGYSNFFGKGLRLFQERKINIIFDSMAKVNPFLNRSEYKDKVINSLKFLSDKSKNIPNEPSVPNIGNWANYRSFFGGKIQSWYTNGQKRKTELRQQLYNLEYSLNKAFDFIEKNFSSKEKDEEKEYFFESIKQSIERLKQIIVKFINFLDKGKSQEDIYSLFYDVFSSFKLDLNLYFHKYLKSEENETIDKNQYFSGIFKKIYKPVNFFGESKKEYNKKIIEKTIVTIEHGIDIVFNLLKKLKDSFVPKEKIGEKENSEIIFRDFLDFYWNKLKNKMINSSYFIDLITKIINESLINCNLEKINQKRNWNRYTFKINEYQKGTLVVFELKKINYLDVFEDKVFEIIDFLISFEKNRLLSDKNILIDWIEVSKNIISKLIKFNRSETFDLDQFNFNLENFPKAANYISIFQLKKLNKKDFLFFIQSLIFSEFKGAAVVFSKEKYLAKYTIQVIDTDEKFKLLYKPKDNKIDKNVDRKGLLKLHEYFICLDEVKNINKKNHQFNFIILEKNNFKPTFIDDNYLSKIYKIESSKYQIQFLDKFLSMPDKYKNIGVKLSEWGFILEQEYKIIWDLEKKRPKFQLIENSRRNKLYLSIPFIFYFKGEKSKVLLHSVLNNSTKYPVLGIDVGEYGLAYALVDFSQKNIIKILKIGFIEDRNIANIKDKFTQIQLKSRRGIFNEADNIVSQVKENAIGNLRNQVHFVLTDGMGASLIYEHSISNFETGSGRVTKIYNSVKRADTKFESKADEQIHNHVWGKNTKYIGKELSAYASSYTCVSCYNSIYQFKKEDLNDINIVKREGNIIFFSSSSYKKTFCGYSKEKKYQPGFKFENKEKNFNTFLKICKDFARPPIGKDKSEVLEKYFIFNQERRNKIEDFRKKRGNSAIFVCPFCQFVADADIQAAFIMAIRGFLKFSEKENLKEKKELIFEKTIKFLKATGFRPQEQFSPF